MVFFLHKSWFPQYVNLNFHAFASINNIKCKTTWLPWIINHNKCRFPNWSICMSALPAVVLPPSPHASAPRSSSWFPPSPGAGRRPADPDAGCCCGCGWPSGPPSFQRWGTWVWAVGQPKMGVFHFSLQRVTHYTQGSCLTWKYKEEFRNWNISLEYVQCR